LSRGVPTWSRDLGSPPRLVTLVNDSSGVGLLVGDDLGRVHRLEALTGEPLWTECLGDTCEGDTGAVTFLDLDIASHRVVAGTATGELKILTADGAVLHARTGAPGYHSGSFGPDGAVFAVESPGDSNLVRLAEDQGTLALTRSTYDVDLVAANADSLWAAQGLKLVEIDPITLLTRSVHTYESLVTVVESPTITHLLLADFDDDGTTDALATLPDASLVIQHADGTLRHHRPAPESVTHGPKSAAYLARTSVYSNLCGPDKTSTGPVDTGTYQEVTLTCRDLTREGNARPLAINVSADSIEYVADIDGAFVLERLDHDLHTQWTQRLRDTQTPQVVALAPYGSLTDPERDVVLVGNDDGTIARHHADTGTYEDAWTLTYFLGRFTFQAPVPGGGFFGSHILVMTVSWTDTGGMARSARLVDWFEAVDADGEPISQPFYHTVLVAEDGSMPMRR
jgi:hypothetical protein